MNLTLDKNFLLLGAAGYIAPRHMKAIRDNEGMLCAALDPNDSVGIIDSFFPEADFFTEFERFDRHIDKLRRSTIAIQYASICTPNYLHDAHIRFALRSGCHAICEKPLVINARNIDPLLAIEAETEKKIYTVLQLRLHNTIKELKSKIELEDNTKKRDIDLTYITARGHWYDYSWKGNNIKSGGIASNIGVHFFDMLGYIFGNTQQSIVHLMEPRRAAGYLEFEKARVRWFLSINKHDLPQVALENGHSTFRSITIGGNELEFSDGFTDLHTETYADILNGGGFSVEDARQSIEIVTSIRNATPIGFQGDYHPFLKRSV